LQNCLAL